MGNESFKYRNKNKQNKKDFLYLQYNVATYIYILTYIRSIKPSSIIANGTLLLSKLYIRL